VTLALPRYQPFNARCTRCGHLLARISLAAANPTPHQRMLAALPHRGCGGRVVPIRQEVRV
jgi:hypothetical protein